MRLGSGGSVPMMHAKSAETSLPLRLNKREIEISRNNIKITNLPRSSKVGDTFKVKHLELVAD